MRIQKVNPSYYIPQIIIGNSLSGLACTILIYLWVNDELSINKFNEKDSQLYQVLQNTDEGSDDIQTSESFCLFQVVAQDKNKPTSPEQQNFTPEQLQEDFALMREVLTTLHPALYEVVSKRQFDKTLDSTSALLKREMDVLEFYKLISPIIAKIGCGHTVVGLPRKEESFIKSFFPLKLKFLNKRAYISENYSNAPLLQPGLEVTSINGKPLSAIVETLFKYIQTDGVIENTKYYFLDRKFDNYYALYIAQPDTFNVEVVNQSGKINKFLVQALGKKVPTVKNASANNKREFPFYMDVVNSNTLRITIDLFYVYDQSKKDAYPRFLDSCFKFINKEKIKNLIIDVRQNSGGYGTWGALLYSYLSSEPFAYYKRAVVATNKPLPFIKHLKLDYTETEYQQYLSEIIETPSGTLLWTNHENLKLQQPQKNAFKGDVYILVGRKSFSTTAEFCAIAYSNKRAVFIGEETGGGYYNINGGELPELTLPNTGIKFQIPMRKYEMAVKVSLPKGSGTIPDFYVPQSIEDFLSNTDTEMKFTLNLVNTKSIRRVGNMGLKK